jgi:aminoglycoside 6-adenylyltransferase
VRSEKEMMDKILEVAGRDERVRAVFLNGSRANPNAPRDILMDYDIVYLVTEYASFRAEPSWIDVFGERVILQTPDDPEIFTSGCRKNRYAYLMQFEDGNRIDLTLLLPQELEAYLREDTQTVLLLDKDGRIPPLPPPSDSSHHLRRPTQQAFTACCNEFWWVSPYVAKGIWRRELPFAEENLNAGVRPMLMQMLFWACGVRHGFAINLGKHGKYLERFLPREDWELFAASYAGGSYEALWQALDRCGELFGRSAALVAEQLGFAYRFEEEERVRAYLRRLKDLKREEQPAGTQKGEREDGER